MGSFTVTRAGVEPFVRYSVTGLISLVVDVGGLLLLHELFGIWAPAAAVLSYLAAFGVNFLLNRNWTFGVGAHPSGPQLVRFTIVAVAAASFLFFGMLWLTSIGMPYLVAKAVLMVLIVVVNFVVMRRWVFGRTSSVRV